jgi:predicted  nucleic acid-binding Zn-ribbon protein
MANESLRQQLALLYQLQERDSELLSIQQKLQTIPRQIEQLEAEVAKYEVDIAAKSEELTEAEKAQRARNAEIEMNAVQREKYQTEQRTVTSNEAYNALEHQIEFLDGQDGEAEDAILILMEESDRLKKELEELEVEVNREKEKTDAETEQFRQELSTLKTKREEKLKQRKAFLPKIDKARRDEYHRWVKAQLTSESGMARLKSGFMALGKDGICGTCRIAIQPQTLKEAQKYEKQVYCSSCKRLLYVEPITSDVPFP